MAKVFISYRRADSAASSGRIYDRLAQRFNKKNVFKDVDNIPAGVRFGEYIQDSLRQCSAVLVIIGRSWLAASTDEGTRRLDDPADWVRVEIETAFALRLTVIPVLVEGATIPAVTNLPESLRELPAINALEVRNDPDFTRDMERVVMALERAFSQPRPRRTPSAPRPVASSTPLTPLVPEAGPSAMPPASEAVPSAMPPAPEAGPPAAAAVVAAEMPATAPAVTQPVPQAAARQAGTHPLRSGRRQFVLLPALAAVLVVVSLSVLLLQKNGSDLAAADRQKTQVAGTHVSETAYAQAFATTEEGFVQATQTAVAQEVHFPYHAAAPGPGCDHGNAPWTFSSRSSQSNLACASDHTRFTGADVEIRWTASVNSPFPQSYTVSIQMSNLSASDNAIRSMTVDTDGGLEAIYYNPNGFTFSRRCVGNSTCASASYSVDPSGTHMLIITVSGAQVRFAVDSHTFDSITLQGAVMTQYIGLEIRSLDAQTPVSTDLSNFSIG